jgi:hypothetical protein
MHEGKWIIKCIARVLLTGVPQCRNERCIRGEPRYTLAMASQNPGWITALVGLFSALFGAVFTYVLNHNKEQTVLLRSKAEQLYLSLDEYYVGMCVYCIEIFGESVAVELPKTVDKSALSLQDVAAAYRVMNMITGIYFPELLPHLNALLSCRDDIDGVVCNNRCRPDEIRNVTRNMEDSTEIFRGKILSHARRPRTPYILSLPIFNGR